MADIINKFYRKIANNGNDSDYELVGTIGVNGIELAVLQGCSASANGQQGLVPAPSAGHQDRILTGDATWKTINTLLSNSGLIKNNLTTSASGSVLDAYQGKLLNDKIASTNSTVSSLNSKITTANNNISSNTTKINTANSNISSVTSRVSSLESKMGKIVNIHGITFSISTGRNIYIMDKAYGPAGEDYGFTIRNGSSSHGEFVNDTYWLSVGIKGMSIGLQVNGAANPEWHWVSLSQ